ncbi:hypothetical protein RJ639_002448 [Escallonia herrerae]|uniref:MYB-CC type transcription factor LHEQLE-containing domain-containing protein n=1 Tax=Escallonia herrerae TaxID=1293975 RepID=A0AA88X9F5_9ASTE|nr:hypothetical protein RJ639_002448 [Escallonia herrerae]
MIIKKGIRGVPSLWTTEVMEPKIRLMRVFFIRSLQISQALQTQMEVQRKLHEQIEVQRHLQLRIEAQGKYLQSVLKKAQDTIAGYNSSSSAEVEFAKAELSQLVSMVETGCPSSSLSVLTETGGSRLNDTVKKPPGGTGYSLESSLTSSESSGRKEDNLPKHKTDDSKNWNRSSVVLPLMEMQPGEKSASSNQGHGRKRSGSTISDGNWVEQPSGKRSFGNRKTSDDQLRKSGYLGTLDLNSQYLNDYDSGPRALDLNCKGLEQLDGQL